MRITLDMIDDALANMPPGTADNGTGQCAHDAWERRLNSLCYYIVQGGITDPSWREWLLRPYHSADQYDPVTPDEVPMGVILIGPVKMDKDGTLMGKWIKHLIDHNGRVDVAKLDDDEMRMLFSALNAPWSQSRRLETGCWAVAAMHDVEYTFYDLEAASLKQGS